MEKIKRKGGKFSYREMITINGKVYKKTFRRKVDANTWKAKMIAHREHLKLHGDVVIYEDVSFGSFVTGWLEEKVKIRNSVGTYHEYRLNIKNHLLPLVCNKNLSKVDYRDADKLVYELKCKGLSVSVINKLLGLFKTILLEAERQGVISKTLLRHYPQLKTKEVPLNFWTVEDAGRFLSSIPKDVYYNLYVVALNTGMRKGELCALTWDKVDFDTNRIEVSRILGRYGFLDSTKNSKVRYIPMNDTIRELLLCEKQSSTSNFVFTRDSGKHLAYDKLCEIFNKHQKQSSLSKRIRFHDLRHSFASNYMMNGGDIYTLQKILGHSRINQTEAYAHLSPEHLMDATQILSISGKNESS